MKSLVFVAAAFSILAACEAGSPVDYDAAIANSRPPSPAIKQALVAAARDNVIDPYSIRDAEISNVIDLPGGRQGVCAKFNSRNRMGGYVGRDTVAVTLQGGRPILAQESHPLCARTDVPWSRFPELEALRDV